MMKSGRRLLLAGVAAFVLALPLYLPAAFVFEHLAGRMPPGISWRQVTGTLLEPRLHNVLIDLPNGTRFVIDEVAVDLGLWPVLTGHIGVQFQARIAGDQITGSGSLGIGRWQIRTLTGNLQVASISGRIPGAELAVSSGQIDLTGEQWSGRYDSFPESGTLHINLVRLQSDLAGPVPLGDYSLLANVDAEGLKGEVTTTDVDAPLNVNAVVAVNPSLRELDIDGTAEAKPTAAEVVRGLLPFFGMVENNRAQIRFVSSY